MTVSRDNLIVFHLSRCGPSAVSDKKGGEGRSSQSDVKFVGYTGQLPAVWPKASAVRLWVCPVELSRTVM